MFQCHHLSLVAESSSRDIDTGERNRYAKFVFKEPQRHEKVKIRVKAELYRYDLLSAKAETGEELAEDDRREDFLKQERYIESDQDEIREIAAGLEGDTEMDVVRQIYDYVLDHMEYVVSGKDDKGARVALERGKGDCTEYADLFVAICRARDIPARVVTGYTVKVDTATSKHNWAEVYLQNRENMRMNDPDGTMAIIHQLDIKSIDAIITLLHSCFFCLYKLRCRIWTHIFA